MHVYFKSTGKNMEMLTAEVTGVGDGGWARGGGEVVGVGNGAREGR